MVSVMVALHSISYYPISNVIIKLEDGNQVDEIIIKLSRDVRVSLKNLVEMDNFSSPEIQRACV